ncbi:MAG TPA: 4Fe-4S binding protein [Smithellaceae bacterium]|nr:4Fe-4S binding protein [Smithellaceae bacterium]HRS89305.1 4Fe-4S binding protein [Smithellaceae bacterium]HRV25175.1 4Fe-4S binding protein [Smithellaceae bacterium]
MRLIKIRILFSSLIFTLFVILFLSSERTATSLSSVLLSFQFVPVLIKIISNPGFLVIMGLVFLLVISLLFGRVYCSFLCPLGAMQDFSIALSRRLRKRKNHSFQKPLPWLRYSILALTVALTLSGSLVLLNLLDPYSLTGRIINHVMEPSFVWIYNLAIEIPKFFHIYLFQKETAYIPPLALVVSLLFFFSIMLLSARHGRLYCNTVCPVGSLLGLISRLFLFKFTLDENHCAECLRCETVCKAGCINPNDKTIDTTRCVACFNCVAACPQPAIKYQYAPSLAAQKKWSAQRRSFVIGSAAALFSVLLAFNNKVRAALYAARRSQKPPATPPGAVNLRRFTQFCSACHLCVSACPTKVLTPSFFEYGAAGLMQPLMDFERSFCDYECNVCGNVCPTGAILPLALEDKKLVRIGKAEIFEDICVVYVDHNNCGACGEVCPTHAISFIDKKNILYPEVDTKYCIGCGACQLVCPTTPKAIVVHALDTHEQAVKYVHAVKPVKRPQMPDADFPF